MKETIIENELRILYYDIGALMNQRMFVDKNGTVLKDRDLVKVAWDGENVKIFHIVSALYKFEPKDVRKLTDEEVMLYMLEQ